MLGRRWIGFCAAALLGLSGWAFGIEPASLTNGHTEIAVPSWPTRCSGLRVAVLADLHVGSPHHGLGMLREIVAETQRLEPDLILLAGDYVIQGVIGGNFVAPEALAAELGRLSAPAGVFAVLGNHDHWLGSARVATAFETVGIPVLEDRSRPLRWQGCEFWLVGVSDFWEGAHDLDGALESVPEGAPTLLLTHNPDLFPEVPPRVSLTLAGHTHGGQVHLPGLGRPIVPSAFGERYAAGHVVEDGRHLFVSTGLGTSILPVRFRVPPEISVVSILSRPASAPSGS